MEDFDLIKAFDEVINTTYPPKEAALDNTTEVPVCWIPIVFAYTLY